MLQWNYPSKVAGHSVEIYDFSIYGPGMEESEKGNGILMRYSDRMADLVIHDLHIEGFNSAGIRFFRATSGLIYSCSFKNCLDAPPYGYGAGVSILGLDDWDDPKPPLGAAAAMFVEDCTFTHCKHGVTSGEGSHDVVRYCSFSDPIEGHSMVDAHGNYSPPPDSGSNTWEVYHCNFYSSDSSIATGVGFRGGSGVCWGNSFSSGFYHWVKLLIDTHRDYPDPYMVKDTYFWDNYADGVLATDVAYKENPTYTKKGREYFMYKKPGYVPYPYPHPMRLARESFSAAIEANPSSGPSPLVH